MKILYGILDNYIDVTDICFENYLFNNKIIIPKNGEIRIGIFNEHLSGIHKNIEIILDNKTLIFSENDYIFIDLDNLDNLYSFEETEISNYHNNLYDYDRNIPEKYLIKFNENEEKYKNNLKLDYMKNNISRELFTQTVFNGMLPQDTYTLKYIKLITMDILLNKSFSFKCLLTNNIYRTNKQIYYLSKVKSGCAAEYDDLNVYIFDDENIEDPFFVVMGNGSSHMVLHTQILFIYYFKKSKLFTLKRLYHLEHDNKTISMNILNYIYKNNILTNNKITGMFGFSPNIAHSYWNDLSGFKFLVDMDLIKCYDDIIIGGFDYYNIYDYLIKNNYNVRKEYNLKNIGINNNFLVKFNDYFMYEDLKNFTIENNVFNNKKEIERINYVKKKYFPIITFNLRGVYRNLYEQEDKISNIINNLLLIYPNMFIIFDGFVINKNVNLTDFKSEGITSNLNTMSDSYKNIVNEIISKINTKNYKSLIGVTLEEELSWLNISTYGLMQMAAGSFNYTWTMNKKCLYVGRNHCVNDSILIHTYHDFIFRENRNFTTYINPNIIDFNTYEHLNKQFNLDWRIIFYFMCRDLIILEKHNFSLSQFENIKQYNIYQSWGIDSISLEELLVKDDFISNYDLLKEKITEELFSINKISNEEVEIDKVLNQQSDPDKVSNKQSDNDKVSNEEVDNDKVSNEEIDNDKISNEVLNISQDF